MGVQKKNLEKDSKREGEGSSEKVVEKGESIFQILSASLTYSKSLTPVLDVEAKEESLPKKIANYNDER